MRKQWGKQSVWPGAQGTNLSVHQFCPPFPTIFKTQNEMNPYSHFPHHLILCGRNWDSEKLDVSLRQSDLLKGRFSFGPSGLGEIMWEQFNLHTLEHTFTESTLFVARVCVWGLSILGCLSWRFGIWTRGRCVFVACWFVGVSDSRPKSACIFTFQNAFYSSSRFISTVYLWGAKKWKWTPFPMQGKWDSLMFPSWHDTFNAEVLTQTQISFLLFQFSKQQATPSHVSLLLLWILEVVQ